MVKEMLSVLMDGIKDADMILDYAATAMRKDDESYNWFIQHGRQRVEQVCDDYKTINRAISLEAKASDGDVIAEALMEHLMMQIDNLKSRI